MPSEPEIVEQQPDHYDAFAEAYAWENENGLFNRWYARPAVLDLLGDVAGRRVLDAGCGSGPLLADLEERGASVAGFDASPAMIRLARERFGDAADVQVADLTQPLPYDDETFDDGATWTKRPVRSAKGGGYEVVTGKLTGSGHVSLKVEVTDTKGDSITQEVIRAYAL